MQRKFLEGLGLEKETADKILDENSADIGKAKGDYEDLKKRHGESEGLVRERDRQLEELKKAAGDDAGLKEQIAKLQAENKAAKEKHEAEMKELKLSAAIKEAIGEKTHDADLVAGLFDRSKLSLSEDGKAAGVGEQMKAIKESKPFLFKAEGGAKKTGFYPLGAPRQERKPDGGSGSGKVDMKSAIEAGIAPQMARGE